MNPSRIIAAVATLLAVTGCPSASSLTSARTLKAGSTIFVVAPTFMSASATELDPSAIPVVPMAEAQIRYGITDNLEFGGKAWFGGFGGHLKIGLVRPESDLDGFNLSIDPGVSYVGIAGVGGGIGYFSVYLPVLAGYRFAGHEVTVGPRLVPVIGGSYGGGASTSGVGYLAGSSIGASFRLGESFRIMPEFSFLTPLGETISGQYYLTQFSLGFGFGS